MRKVKEGRKIFSLALLRSLISFVVVEWNWGPTWSSSRGRTRIELNLIKLIQKRWERRKGWFNSSPPPSDSKLSAYNESQTVESNGMRKFYLHFKWNINLAISASDPDFQNCWANSGQRRRAEPFQSTLARLGSSIIAFPFGPIGSIHNVNFSRREHNRQAMMLSCRILFLLLCRATKAGRGRTIKREEQQADVPFHDRRESLLASIKRSINSIMDSVFETFENSERLSVREKPPGPRVTNEIV